MKTIFNTSEINLEQQVHALFYLNAFDTICTKSKGMVNIVPLKGIDLLRFLYADTLDRELHDIDLLVFPPQKAMDFIEMLQKDGYRQEFSHALDKVALASKKKVSMLPSSDLLPHIDVHLAFITKKFFSDTINDFNQDALSRLKKVDDVVYILDDVDRWLYLSTHFAFHYLTGDKWCRDLILILERFNEEQRHTLLQRTEQYHLERVVWTVVNVLQSRYPEITDKMDILHRLSEKMEKRFMHYIHFITSHPQQVSHGFRLSRYYWEFIFISHSGQRFRALIALLFPSLGDMQNIYRCHILKAIVLYIPHILMNTLGMFAFWIQYNLFANYQILSSNER